MKSGTYSIDLDFDQILDLVRQLPRKEKMRLSKELEMEIVDAKLTALLKAFKTDDLDANTIQKEADFVRTDIYAKSKPKLPAREFGFAKGKIELAEDFDKPFF